MDKAVREWVDKAEEDYHVALALRRVRRHPTHNAVCFHAQQCVEKYLKAILEKQKRPIKKIHALPVLLDQCAESHPMMTALRPDMVLLSVYAVEFRYPGESASSADARYAIDIMKRSRADLRRALGLAGNAGRTKRRARRSKSSSSKRR